MISREVIKDMSRGDDLRHFWGLFYRHQRAKGRLARGIYAFLLNRSAARHGGYVGVDAKIAAPPSMPHGLHGVFISRYAEIGVGCRIYQNVTIGEVGGEAPKIGDNCLIGAGAVLVGGINIGAGAKIGAGAVVAQDIPAGATAVSELPRIITKEVMTNE